MWRLNCLNLEKDIQDIKDLKALDEANIHKYIQAEKGFIMTISSQEKDLNDLRDKYKIVKPQISNALE